MCESVFELFQNEKFKEAYEVADKAFNEENDTINLRARADALMFMKDYSNALKDYLEIINLTDPSFKGDNEYIDVGIAYWLVNDKDMAISAWNDGLDKSVKYTSNIINVPAILYFASASLKDKKLLAIANKYLKRRWKSKIPLAGFLLDELSLEQLIESASRDPILRERQLCKFYFYIAAKCLMNDDFNGYKNYLYECKSIKGRYLEFEYHLAVGELDKINIKYSL